MSAGHRQYGSPAGQRCGEKPGDLLAAKLKSRSVSPVDLLETCLDRIAKFDPKLHAFVEVYVSRSPPCSGGG